MNRKMEAEVVPTYQHKQRPTWRIYISVLATLALQISDPGSYSGTLPREAPARVLLNQKLQYPASILFISVLHMG